MSLAQLCDVAYAIQLRYIEERHKAAEIGYYVGKASGAEGGELPDLMEAIRGFDEWLNEEWEVIDQDKRAAMEFYGLGRGRR